MSILWTVDGKFIAKRSCVARPQSLSPFRVIFDRGETVGRSRHVGYAPESGSKIRVLASTAMGLCELMASPGT
jgi:hypothetical protein